jgi:cystathionine beta-lyase/cystathionine gamma-synthase
MVGSPHRDPLAMSEPRINLGKSTPLVPPLYQSSVYTLPDLDELDRIMNAESAGYIYARDGHPNAQFLAKRVADLEGAGWGLITGSGMGALSAILLATLDAGRRVVASNRLYGRTTQLLQQEFGRFGVSTAFIDCNDLDAVREALSTPTRVLLVETVSNPLLRVADIPALAEIAHAAGTLLVVDNTFATPVLTRPLQIGADLIMESLTKMIGGHADITLGVVCGKEDFLPEVSQALSIWGLSANPFDCWLTERGLNTLPLRMKAACGNARELAGWLKGQPGVSRVLYPGLPEHADHALAPRILGGEYGNMLSFELSGGREAVNRFIRGGGVPFSPSLGNTTTTLSHPGTTSHRHVSPAEKARQGITDGLIRLSVGIEDIGLIKEQMARGL